MWKMDTAKIAPCGFEAGACVVSSLVETGYDCS